MILKSILYGLGLMASLISFSSFATVIDFQQLEQNTGGPFRVAVGTNTYLEDGFQIDYLGNRPSDGFYSLGTLDSRYTGSTALFNNTPDGLTELTKVGGGTFDLFSIDLANMDGALFGDVTFTTDSGYSQTFTSDGSSLSQTFLFDAGFLGATSVSWIQTLSYLEFHQFDNINIDVSAVPIPAAVFMFAPALLGFFGLRRKAKITAV